MRRTDLLAMATDTHALLLLLNWMSPTFPIGGFAYSHGMEQAIADGRLRETGAVQAWIASLISCGSGWSDAVIFALAWQDDTTVNDLALALSASAERHGETTHLGRAFNQAAAVWAGAAAGEAEIAYPVAAAQACKAAGIALEDGLTGFVQGFCAAQVSVAVRLVPLGQTAGLLILRDLAPVIAETVGRAKVATLDELGSACIAADIAAMNHEILQPRIFRT